MDITFLFHQYALAKINLDQKVRNKKTRKHSLRFFLWYLQGITSTKKLCFLQSM